MSVAKLLLAGIEGSYGTDPTLDATNAIETQDLEMLRYEGDRIEREVDRSTLGGVEQVNSLPHTNTSFNVDFAGSGAAGTAPLWGELMRACGFNETVNVGVDVTYILAATADELNASDSVSFYDYRAQANKMQVTSGCRGANEISMSTSELPKIMFTDFIGSYLTPAQGTEPSGIDWSGWLAANAFTFDNVPVITLDNIAACTEAFNINFGQSVSRRNAPNCESTVISDYNVTGGMTIVAPDIAVVNWWQKQESHSGITKYPFALTIGTVAGNIMKIECPEVQIINTVEGESSQGDLSYEFEFAFIGAVTVTAM